MEGHPPHPPLQLEDPSLKPKPFPPRPLPPSSPPLALFAVLRESSKSCDCNRLRSFFSSLGIRPTAVTATLITSGNGQNCNCNPQSIPPEQLVDCNDFVADGIFLELRPCGPGTDHKNPESRKSEKFMEKDPESPYDSGVNKSARERIGRQDLSQEVPSKKGSLGVMFSPRNYRENAHSKSANFEGRHSGGHLLGRPLLFTSESFFGGPKRGGGFLFLTIFRFSGFRGSFRRFPMEPFLETLWGPTSAY